MSRYRETMTDLYRQVQENAGDYLKSKMTDTQINNIKKTWSMKTAKDVTPAIRDMIKKMDIPTQLAIKHANINQLSKLVEVVEEGTMIGGLVKHPGQPASESVQADAEDDEEDVGSGWQARTDEHAQGLVRRLGYFVFK